MHLFLKTLFWHPDNLQQIFSHPYTLFVNFKTPPKHYKIGENKQTILDQVARNLGPSLDAKATKSWTKFCL